MAATAGLIFLDFETHSNLNLKTVGSAKYAASCSALVLAYAIGDGPVHTVEHRGAPVFWKSAPPDLKHAVSEGFPIVAWNAGFDMQVWEHAFGGGVFGAPPGTIETALDARVLAAAANLPPDLESASMRLLGVGKDKEGKKLIKLFSIDGADPLEHPEEWQAFLRYARIDVERMRDIWRRLLPLPDREWEEYHAAERINRRGVSIDLGFAQFAAKLAAHDRVAGGKRVAQLTHGLVHSITDLPRMKTWLYNHLDSEARKIMVKVIDEEDETDRKLRLRRPHIDQLIAYLENKPELLPDDLVAKEILELRLYGGGASQGKFQAIVDQAHHDKLAMTYVFAGATQTGRFSSKRPQLHNLTRQSLSKTIADEADMMGALINGRRNFGDDVPMARRLALLVRPTLMAREGHTFVWSDWSSIESRVLAFLANDADANKKLDVYRQLDADPTLPDIYMQVASGMLHITAAQIDSDQRQRGKIAELACGFAGGIGALQSMAANYKMHFTDDEARTIVDQWRQANPWARPFWDALWSGAMIALDTPDSVRRVGRLLFKGVRHYLGERTLFMQLPSGRRLIYPDVRITTEKDYDADGEVIGYTDKLTFKRDRGRVKLWKGILAENATQAVAADILRGTLVRLEQDTSPIGAVCLHTHDEIMLEVETEKAKRAANYLVRMMTLPFAWSADLPIAAKAKINDWYSKAGD